MSMPEKVIFKVLSQIKYGNIIIHTDENRTAFLGSEAVETHAVTVYIKNSRAYKTILLKGSMGAAESYIAGDWQTDDLSKLIEIFIKNMDLLKEIDGNIAKLANLGRNFFGKWHINRIDQAKADIHAHYDIGNEFFKLFLDPTLMYSCALYEPENLSQEAASINKLETICRYLELKASDHILEIGTGWGGFAFYAARKYGCKVTTTTISDKQYEFVKNEILRLGLENRIELLNQDYRELTGQYDKVVSIEMIEAVGHPYFDIFFHRCNSLLRPGGLFFLQAIVINDQSYERAKNEIDFIKKYIFPGGCLPSISSMMQSIADQTKMQMLKLNDIGKHYVFTLSDWYRQINFNKQAILNLGFNENFIRMWQYYFCYCIAGFRTKHISVIHALWYKR